MIIEYCVLDFNFLYLDLNFLYLDLINILKPNFNTYPLVEEVHAYSEGCLHWTVSNIIVKVWGKRVNSSKIGAKVLF